MAPSEKANVKKKVSGEVKKVAVFDGNEKKTESMRKVKKTGKKVVKIDDGKTGKRPVTKSGAVKMAAAKSKTAVKPVVKAKAMAVMKPAKSVAKKATKKTVKKQVEKVKAEGAEEKENFLAGETKTAMRKRVKNAPGRTSAERVAELNAEIRRDKYREMAKKSKGVAMDVKVVKEDINGVPLGELDEAFSEDELGEAFSENEEDFMDVENETPEDFGEEELYKSEEGRDEVLSDESLGIDEVLSGNIDENEASEEVAPEEIEISDVVEPSEMAKEALAEEEKAPKVKKEGKFLKVIQRVFAIIATGAMAYLGYAIFQTQMLPMMYVGMIIAGLSLLAILFMFKAFRKKTGKVMRVIMTFLEMIATGASVFGVIYINNTMTFLNNNFGVSENVAIYNVIVGSGSKKSSLADVKDGVIYAYRDLTVEQELLTEAVKDQAKASVSYEADLDKLRAAVMKERLTAETTPGQEGEESMVISLSGETSTIAQTEDPAVMMAEGTYEMVKEQNKDFEEKTKVIGQIRVKMDMEKVDSVSDITTNPFVVYLSGIDTRTNDMPAVSLSDVNMVVAVNPKTRQMLLVSIPRDYFVQLHGTSAGALRDKLTHAGGLGGVQLSMATIEDFMGVDINYYARVNFNFLERLVDAIGGITIESDTAFSAWTDRSCYFKVGENPVNGMCALAFARERHAYESGDRHRGENQEQVIKLILEKVTQSSTILSKYNDILAALDGTFETSLETKDISAFIQMHVDDMTPWKMMTANLDGTTGMTYTYSSPGQQLSVMYPNEETILKATEAIKVVLEGGDISEKNGS
ncbi:MAG: LCP family protein [Candidatus Saccharibacteria bacterium]|nr:LCP family protein [Candidatus Saccharibacteria bacterium]